jgi:hypothetical protein
VWKKPRTPFLRVSTIETDSATAAPFCPARNHTQCRGSRTSLCREVPGQDAFALAWRACRSGRTAGSPPTLQNLFVALVALVLPLRTTILPESRARSNGGNSTRKELCQKGMAGSRNERRTRSFRVVISQHRSNNDFEDSSSMRLVSIYLCKEFSSLMRRAREGLRELVGIAQGCA